MTKASIYGHSNFLSPSVDICTHTYKIQSVCLGGEAALCTAGAVVDLLFSTVWEEPEELSEQHQVSCVLYVSPEHLTYGSSSQDRYTAVLEPA